MMMWRHDLSSFSHSLLKLLPSPAHGYRDSMTTTPRDYMKCTSPFILSLRLSVSVLAFHILCLISCGRSRCSGSRREESAEKLVNPQPLHMCSHGRVELQGQRLIVWETPQLDQFFKDNLRMTTSSQGGLMRWWTEEPCQPYILRASITLVFLSLLIEMCIIVVQHQSWVICNLFECIHSHLKSRFVRAQKTFSACSKMEGFHFVFSNCTKTCIYPCVFHQGLDYKVALVQPNHFPPITVVQSPHVQHPPSHNWKLSLDSTASKLRR